MCIASCFERSSTHTINNAQRVHRYMVTVESNKKPMEICLNTPSGFNTPHCSPHCLVTSLFFFWIYNSLSLVICSSCVMNQYIDNYYQLLVYTYVRKCMHSRSLMIIRIYTAHSIRSTFPFRIYNNIMPS